MLLRAFAKINLDLRILGKRQDGYHEVRTVFQAIDWFDEIRVVANSRFEFWASHGPQNETNLVVRAVRAFEKCAKLKAEVSIRLTKNIPSGAGLGGGSADAAVTFLGLERFFGRDIAEADRMNALRSLGSDIPFFAVGGRASGSGRGDEVVPLDDGDEYWLVLVHPGVSIATAEAYSWLTVSDKPSSIEGFRTDFVSDPESGKAVNDFEQPVFNRYPKLKGIRDELVRIGAFRAALSGSGSVLFGQFHSETLASQAAALLKRDHSVRVARPLSRSEYFSKIMAE
jgi:4-diphosphocytidyl-2-C-methyl-D-erythritol kinase